MRTSDRTATREAEAAPTGSPRSLTTSVPPGRFVRLAWALAAPGVVLLASLLPLLRTRDYYFRDDTEIGAYPIWYRLGQTLRAGEWPILEPSSWMAGNIAAEGQWGLFSPITLGVSLLSTTVTSAVVFSTAVKLAFLMVAALGGYVLARSYDVRPPLAFAAGVALPLNGFTLYMDAPSWVTGLMTWALLPYAWAFLRRCTHKGKSPLPFLLVAYLIVTIGYFHGFLALGVVIIAVGLDRLVLRDWRSVAKVVAGGVFCLLLAATVYLAGILTAEVTNRSNDTVLNSGFLTGDLTGLLTAASPTGMYRISGWWGPFTSVPLLYMAWFLPAAAFVAWSRVTPVLRELRDALILGVTALLVVLGPSDLGPIRFPVRVMPYLTLAVLLALVVLLDRSITARPSRGALGVAVAWSTMACYLGYSQRPDQLGPISVWTAAACAGALAAAWWFLRWSSRLGAGRASLGLAGVLAFGCVAATAAQTSLYPESPLAHFDMPGQVEGYKVQIPAAVNDVIVVGSPTRGVDEFPESRFDDERRAPRPPDSTRAWDEVLLGNSWLVNDAAVQNTYTVIQHAAYERVVCMSYRGETCPELVQRLFRNQPGLSLPLVDVLSIDTVYIIERDAPAAAKGPPEGWSEAHEGAGTVTWTRDEPVGGAGGVVWTSTGTSVTELGRADRNVRLRVDRVGDDGGRVVFSRLAWPGYTADGGDVVEVNDYLLGVDLPAGSQGEVVEVSFSPPGWGLSKVALAAALLLGAGWSLLALVLARQRRRRADRPSAADEAPLPETLTAEAVSRG